MAAWYKDKDFKSLEAHWYQKLKEEGFEDAENVSKETRPLKVEHGYYYICRYDELSFKQKEEYFRLCDRFRNEFPFDNEFDQAVFGLHAAGRSNREIAKVLEASGYIANKDKVGAVVNRLVKIMKAMLIGR